MAHVESQHHRKIKTACCSNPRNDILILYPSKKSRELCCYDVVGRATSCDVVVFYAGLKSCLLTLRLLMTYIYIYIQGVPGGRD